MLLSAYNTLELCKVIKKMLIMMSELLKKLKNGVKKVSETFLTPTYLMSLLLFLRLFVSNCFDRVHVSGFSCGDISEEHSDKHANGEADVYRPCWNT